MFNSTQSRCTVCGRYFRPELGAGSRQITCLRDECRKRRKRQTEKEWRDKDPDYSKNFYKDYIKPFREKNPNYQKEWRAKRSGEIKTLVNEESPIKSMRLHIRLPTPEFEISTLVFRVKQTGSTYWIDGERMQANRDKHLSSHIEASQVKDSS